jgi:hypothetical protein
LGKTWWQRDFWRWLVLFIAAGLIAYMFISAGRMSNQFSQLGSELGAQRAEATRVAEYKYVVDLEHKLYYPNEPQYVQAIAREYRVYVVDDETIKQWVGYKPGPRRR